MKYARILAAVASTPWAIDQAKGAAIMQFLAFAAAGGVHSPGEIEVILGRPARAYDDDGPRETPAERAARLAAQDQQQIADRGGIAVLSLEGVISPRMSGMEDTSGGASAEGFARKLSGYISDPRVAGIVVDVDSPGGNVLGIHEAARAMRQARGVKPVAAVANPTAASAAYWIASNAGSLAVMPSGEVGSIGVYGYHEDISERLAKFGIKPTLIKSGISPNKAETASAFPLTPDAAAHMQAGVDRYGAMFIGDVAAGRGVAPDKVQGTFGGGRMLGAEDALKVGMVDRIATLDEEIARMRETVRGRVVVAAPQAATPTPSQTAARRRRLALA